MGAQESQASQDWPTINGRYPVINLINPWHGEEWIICMKCCNILNRQSHTPDMCMGTGSSYYECHCVAATGFDDFLVSREHSMPHRIGPPDTSDKRKCKKCDLCISDKRILKRCGTSGYPDFDLLILGTCWKNEFVRFETYNE